MILWQELCIVYVRTYYIDLSLPYKFILKLFVNYINCAIYCYFKLISYNCNYHSDHDIIICNIIYHNCIIYNVFIFWWCIYYLRICIFYITQQQQPLQLKIQYGSTSCVRIIHKLCFYLEYSDVQRSCWFQTCSY